MQTKSAKEDQPDYHALVGNLRTGNRSSKMLLTGREDSPDNYKLSYGGDSSPSDWSTPRHRHTFEQIRWAVSGDYMIKKDEMLPAGWVAYFPESVYYGPQIKYANSCQMTLQFGGPSGIGYWSMRQRGEAYKTLAAKGAFEDGFYVWTDADGRKRKRDAAEAVQDEALGRKIEYPEPRYKDIVSMNPEAFGWDKDSELSGVSRKRLGSFTERDVRVQFINMDKGANLPLGLEKSAELLFLKSGLLAHDNSTYDDLTALGTEADEAPVTLTAIEPSELMYIKLPTF
jgi:hypothetical protein